MAFEWHSKKAERNLKDHGGSFDEAATAFDDPFAEFLPDCEFMKDEIRLLEDDDYDPDDTVEPEYDIEAIDPPAGQVGRP